MKRGWAALILFLIAAAIGVTEYVYVDTSTRMCIDMLNEADRHMEKNEMYEAQEIAGRIDNRFCSQAAVYDVFLFHSEVADISGRLAALRRYAQIGDVSEFLAASAGIKRSLTSIHNSRIPMWENVF